MPLITAPEPPFLRALRAPADDEPGNYTYFGSWVRWAGITGGDQRRVPFWLNEEYFEYLTLAESISEARSTFTICELGAGFGRWSVIGALAARRSGRDCKIVAVEAEHGHFKMLLQHFADNNLDISRHKLVNAAVSARRGKVFFTQGNSEHWWGQAILPSATYGHGQGPEVVTELTESITLDDLLSEEPYIDLIDMDIQGAEAELVAASLDTLRTKVRRVHIGTHSANIESALRKIFSRMGWQCRFDFAGGGIRDTPHGQVKFGDGVQSWLNPELTQ